MSLPQASLEAWQLDTDIGIPANSFFAIVGLGLLWIFSCGIVHVIFHSYKIRPSSADDRSVLSRIARSKEVWYRLIFLAICAVFGVLHLEATCHQQERQVDLLKWMDAQTLASALDADWRLRAGASFTFAKQSLKFTGERPNTNDFGWQLRKVGVLEGVTGTAQSFFATLSNSSFPVRLTLQQVKGSALMQAPCERWYMIYWYSVLLIVTTGLSLSPREFFLGEGTGMRDSFNYYFRGREVPKADDQPLRENDERSYGGRKLRVGFWTLMPSAFISWIFAKSIHNASVLGGQYGLLGGVAYAGWYTSFFSAALVGYVLRTRYGYFSLPEAVHKTYGSFAALLFMLCVLFRLHNEVWSNAAVIGNFFGRTGSSPYWGAAWFSVLVPAAYTCMGGMRGSLFTDVLQAWGGVLILVVVLASLGADKTFQSDAFTWKPEMPRALVQGGQPGWEAGWLQCFIGGLIQGICSYPFFDAVLTDRAFLSSPKTMALSLTVGGIVAALFIFLFSALGVYGAYHSDRMAINCDCTSDCFDKGLVTAPGVLTSAECQWWAANRKSWGSWGDSSYVGTLLAIKVATVLEVLTNFIMITASMSTLDSTFASGAKLMALEFGGWLSIAGEAREKLGPLRPHDVVHITPTHIWVARTSIVVLVCTGVAFLGFESDAMNATTVAGTAVMGIGPPVWALCLWRTRKGERRGWRSAPLAFILPYAVGWFFGAQYWIDQKKDPSEFRVTYDKFQFTNYYNTFNCQDLPWTLCARDASAIAAGCKWVPGTGGAPGSCTGPSFQVLTSIRYARFLGTNIVGHLACIGAFIVGFAIHQYILPGLTGEVLSNDEATEGSEGEGKPDKGAQACGDEAEGQEKQAEAEKPDEEAADENDAETMSVMAV